ncbi:MAG: TolC family protein [Planctomycetia bacterium]|nr:TolC family protein [Planctomycetia bacterium]
MKFKIFIILSLFLCNSWSIGSENRIADLQSYALSRNPGIRVLDQRVEAARGLMIQAGLPLNPVAGYVSDDIGVGGTSGKHGIEIAQEIETGNKRAYATEVANLETQSIMLEREILFHRVNNEVRTLAWKVQSARRMLHIRKELKKLAEETEQMGTKFRKINEISEMNLLHFSVQKHEADLAVLVARNREIAAEKELKAFLGPDFGPIGELADSLESLLEQPEKPEDELLNSILTNNPRMMLAKLVVRQKQTELALERANSRPNITVGGGVFYDTQNTSTVAAAGIALPIQIFDRNQGNIRSAQAGYAAAVQEVEQVQLEIQQKFAVIYQEYRIAREESLIYKKDILPKLNKSYEMSIQAYKKSELEILEIFNSQVAVFDAWTKYIDSLTRLAETTTLLEGMLLESDEYLD